MCGDLSISCLVLVVICGFFLVIEELLGILVYNNVFMLLLVGLYNKNIVYFDLFTVIIDLLPSKYMVAFDIVQYNLLTVIIDFVAIEISCDYEFGTVVFCFLIVHVSFILDLYMIVKMEVQGVI